MDEYREKYRQNWPFVDQYEPMDVEKGDLDKLLDDLLAIRVKLEENMVVNENSILPNVKIINGMEIAMAAKALANVTLAIYEEDYGERPSVAEKRAKVDAKDLPF